MTERAATNLFAAYCLLHRQWGLMLSFAPATSGAEHDALAAACPLYPKLHIPTMAEGQAFLFFESEAEARDAFGRTVGKDGPTKLNAYDGPARVFALLCGPDGKLVTENT